MSQGFKINGPSFWCTGTGSAGALQFLGLCEGVTTISFASEEEDIRTDASGNVPHDVQWMGEQARISGEIIRYDESIFQQLQSRFPNAGGIVGNGVAGTFPTQGVGALYAQEGNSIRFLVYAPYGNKTQQSDMYKGYNFLSAWMAGNMDTSVGTKVKRNRVTMRAIPQWTISATGAAGVLWNQTVTGLPTFS